jgi:hypothetical protein
MAATAAIQSGRERAPIKLTANKTQVTNTTKENSTSASPVIERRSYSQKVLSTKEFFNHLVKNNCHPRLTFWLRVSIHFVDDKIAQLLKFPTEKRSEQGNVTCLKKIYKPARNLEEKK